MVLKAFAVTRRWGVWFGLGMQDKVTWPVTRTWLRTVFPPYLRGTGLNVSLFRVSLRVGAYRDIGLYVYDEYDNVDVEGELAALEWSVLEDEGEVIRSWQSSETRPKASSTEQ